MLALRSRRAHAVLRWREFDTELDAAWERILAELQQDDLPAAAK